MSINEEQKEISTVTISSPKPPLVTVTSKIYTDRIEVETDYSGKQSKTQTKLFRHHRVTIYHEDPNMPQVSIFAKLAGDRKPLINGAGAKKWLCRALALVAHLSIWPIILGSHGFVGWCLEYSVDSNAAIIWEVPILLTLLAGFLFYAFKWGAAQAALVVLYVLGFPFVVFWLCLRTFFSVTVLLYGLLALLKSLMLRGANWTLLFVAWLVIVQNNNQWIILAGITYVFVGLLFIVLSNFYWISTPFPTVVRFFNWLDPIARDTFTKAGDKIAASVKEYRSLADAGEREKKKSVIIKEVESMISNMRFASTIKENVGHMIVRVFLYYVFLFRMIALVFSVLFFYAAIYRGIAKVDSQSFSGESLGSWWDALYFSATTFFTIGYSTVFPASVIAEVAVFIQILFGLTVITLFALSFSTIGPEATKENQEKIRQKAIEVFGVGESSLKDSFVYPSDQWTSLVDLLKKDFDARLVDQEKPIQ